MEEFQLKQVSYKALVSEACIGAVATDIGVYYEVFEK